MYFYKNMKPYYKYTLPSLPIDSLEKDIWNRVRIELYLPMHGFDESPAEMIKISTCVSVCDSQLPIDKADNYDASIKKLKSMSIKDLSIVSQNLLTLSTDERQVIRFNEAITTN